MMEDPGQHLILHGSICLLIGLVCGAPMGSAINQNKGSETINAWRVAHLSLTLGGIMLFSLASIIPRLALSDFWLVFFSWSFIISTYGFIVALPYGAIIGERGLTTTAGKGNIVRLGNLVGAGGSVVGALILLAGAAHALRA